jgi:hypothetical protein
MFSRNQLYQEKLSQVETLLVDLEEKEKPLTLKLNICSVPKSRKPKENWEDTWLYDDQEDDV